MSGPVKLSSLEALSITSKSTPTEVSAYLQKFGEVFEGSGFDAEAIINSDSPKADYIRNKMALLLNQFVKAARKLA